MRYTAKLSALNRAKEKRVGEAGHVVLLVGLLRSTWAVVFLMPYLTGTTFSVQQTGTARRQPGHLKNLAGDNFGDNRRKCQKKETRHC
jgi:hypothetical protein